MTNLSNTNTSTSIVKYIINNSKEVILRLRLVLATIHILILLNNPIIDTIVVNEYLVWNTNTHMVFKSYTPLWVSMRVSSWVWIMNNQYYTYQDLMVMLSCTKRTLERKLSKMNIKKRYLGGSKPYFLAVDIHSFILFNVPFNQYQAER